MSNNKTYKVAVVGATGAVGEAMLSVLAERKFPVGELVALASERSAGDYVKFGNDEVMVRDLATFDPTGIDIALFSAGGSISKEYGPKFAAAGAVVMSLDYPLAPANPFPQAIETGYAGTALDAWAERAKLWAAGDAPDDVKREAFRHTLREIGQRLEWLMLLPPEKLHKTQLQDTARSLSSR